MEKQGTCDNLPAPLSNQPDPSFLQNSCTGKEIESDGSKPREEDSEQGNVAAPCDGPIKTTSSCGGFTCCVPRCYHNSRRDKHLKFYQFPNGIGAEKIKLRKKWISLISRKDFLPTNSHRVCSANFPGGQKHT